MKKTFILFTFISFGLSAFAQHLHQVLILNEGYFDYTNNEIVVPASVGVYDPIENTYNQVLELTGMRFGSDLVIDGDFYYVAADTKIFKIDLDSHEIISSVTCEGVRNLCVNDGKVYATRGEYLVTYDSYLHVYEANDLSLMLALDTINGPKWATQNILSFDNKVYFAINNAYEWGNEKGIIGVFNSNTMTYETEIDLGPDAKNPDNLVLFNGSLYTVNNKDWSGSSISKLSLDFTTNETVNLSNASTGCGTSALRDDKLIYQISMENTLNEFDIDLMNNVGPVSGNFSNFYELSQDPVNGFLYTSETDFFSYGNVKVYDQFNSEISSFQTGISPGTIVFDVRFEGGISEISQNTLVYPNPAKNILHVSEAQGEKIIRNMLGEEVLRFCGSKVEITALSSGMYFVEVQDSSVPFMKN